MIDLSGLSTTIAKHSGRPAAQLGFVAFCAAWLLLAMGVDLLTMALSVVAISLSQMVLYSQQQREAEATRRDIAMHAKLDELILATDKARDDMAHVEELAEEEIEEKRL